MLASADTAVGAGPAASTQAWFAGGGRVGYDPKARSIVAAQDAPLKIFLRREGDVAHAVSFLPGFPDGSFGWAKVCPHLPSATEMPKLFVEYVGMGDSDKPKDYAYSTAERADLVEAIWRNLSVRSTTLVAFDFSSLVILEHLRRRLERLKRGEQAGGPDIRGVFIFNGGLFTDGHSHPWYTTPMLRRLPARARRGVGRPFALFKRMPGVRKMWSKGYHVTDADLSELHRALDRHEACSTSPQQQASSLITKRKAIGSTSTPSSRLIAISSHSLSAEVTKIRLSIAKSTSRKNGGAGWGSRSRGCPAVTSPRMSSREPWRA
jgi:pimeloyl-ACP methyl ester carboxylesterase